MNWVLLELLAAGGCLKHSTMIDMLYSQSRMCRWLPKIRSLRKPSPFVRTLDTVPRCQTT